MKSLFSFLSISFFLSFFSLNVPLISEAKCLRLVSALSVSLPLVSGSQATGLEKTKLQVWFSSGLGLRWPEVTGLSHTSDTA